MKLFAFQIFAAILISGCDIPERVAQAAVEEPKLSPSTNESRMVGASSAVAVTQTNVWPRPSPPPELDLPEPVREVIKLAHEQIGDSVLTNFIANLNKSYQLNADQIVYLRDVGISTTVMEALLAKQQLFNAVQAPKEASNAVSPASKESQSSASIVPVTESPSQQAKIAPVSYPGGTQELPAPQVDPAIEHTTPARDQQPTVNNSNFFYDSLAPYGNWVTVPNYGYVWQPSCTVVTPGWRPYWNNGSWIWSDSGWYWNSYYSWGWAPFHYGNWFNDPGYGWCWTPGSVWGPSWVTFRYSSGYCGWAPLPPGCGWRSGVGLTWSGGGIGVGFGFGFTAANYCWTPTGYFSAAHCSNYGLAGPQAANAYNNSKVVNNYIVGNNNTIINGGIDPRQIRQHSRSEVRKVQLSDTSSPSEMGRRIGPSGRPGEGDRLSVYRPAITPGASAPRAMATKRSELRPTQVTASSLVATDRRGIPARPHEVRGGTQDQTRIDRIDIPAGSRNPLGNSVQLLNRPTGAQSGPTTSLNQRNTEVQRRESPAPTPRTLDSTRGTPAANVSQSTTRYVRRPNQQANAPSRLEPRSQLPPSASSRNPNFTGPNPSAGSASQFSNTESVTARTPPITRGSTYSRPQSAPTAIAPISRSPTPGNRTSFPAPRNSYSTPSPNSPPLSQSSRVGRSAGSVGRPGSRQSP